MFSINKIKCAVFVAVALAAVSAQAQFAATGTTSVSVTVGAEASLQVNTATTTLTNVGSVFNAYTGATSLTYKMRSTNVGGTGTITLKVTTDFGPAGGPSVLTPPTAGDALAYSCVIAAPAASCAGPITSSTAAATSVATFGTDAHSANAGNAGSINWTLTDDPLYVTGTYAATVTFTISAT